MFGALTIGQLRGVHLKAYDTVNEPAHRSAAIIRRPHLSLDRQTSDQAYFSWLLQIAAASELSRRLRQLESHQS
jgi:hypothetical protein